MDKTSNKYWVLCVYLALVAATFIAYEQLRSNEFVNYDDDVYVTENPHINRGITRQSVLWAFTTPHRSMWHPLTSLSHMLDCQLFGLNPFWHHLTNLLLHVASTLLLFGILKRTTGEVWLSAFVAAVFALHPLNVESVAWTAERKSVLSVFFWMLTIAAYIRYAEHPAIGRYLLVVLTLSLGLLAKPMVVTLPFVLLLLDYWPLCRFQWGHQSRDEALPKSESVKVSCQSSPAWRLITEKIPLFILAAVLSVITFVAQKGGDVVMQIDEMPLNFRITNAVFSYAKYIEKMIWPSRLAVFYPHPGGTLPIWPVVVSALLLLAISIWVIRLARSRRYLLVGWLWYLGTLVPVIGLVQVGGQARADRYMYLPMIGLLIMIAWGAGELTARWRYRKMTLGVSTPIVLLALAVCTWFQVGYWRNSITLFEHALEATENNYIAHCCLSDALRKLGKTDQAVAHNLELLRIRPNDLNAHNNLGVASLEQGRLSEAIIHFTKVLQLEPDYSEAHVNLGVALTKQGKLDEAITCFTEALRLKPDFAEAHYNFANALKRQGRFNEAVEHYNEALKLVPNDADIHYSLGLALAQLRRYDEAVDCYKTVIQLRPGFAKAHFNLGRVLLNQGKLDGAIEQFRQVLHIRPEDAEMHCNLGVLLAQKGRIDQAIEEFRAALRLDPNLARAHKQLQAALAKKAESNPQ